MKQLLHIVSILLIFGGVAIAQPTLNSVSPSRNAIDISVNSNIVLTFSEAMNESNAEQPNSVQVKGSLRGIYTTTKSLDAFGTTLTINPDSSFIPGEIITVRVSQILNDAQTNGLQRSHVFNFTVETNGTGVGYFSSSDTFTGSIGDSGANLTYMGDVDGDGDLDAIVLRRSDDTKFYVMRKVNGSDSYLAPGLSYTFDIADGSNPQDAELKDIDNDGDLDFIVYVNPGANTLSHYTYTNDGFGSFSLSNGSFHSNLPTTAIGGGVFSDYDVDGDDDIFILADNVYGMWPFANSSGTFTEGTGVGQFSSIAGRAAVTADFNNDDYPDFAIIKQIDFGSTATNDSLGILLSDGSGGFTSDIYTFGVDGASFDGAWGMDSGDLDGDGYIDLVINTNDSLFVFENDQDGTFTPRGYKVTGSTRNVEVADMDNDGDLDVAILSSYSTILYNDGTGDLTSSFAFSRGYSGIIPALGDADGDGDLDIVYSVNSTMTVLRNSVVTAPSTNPTSISLNANQGSELEFIMNGGFGTKALVLMKEGAAVDATPTDDVSYTANSTFGGGSELGSGNYVVYDGTSTTFTVDGLIPNTTYHVEVFQFNAAGPSVKYQTGDITITSATTRLSPNGIVSNLSATTILTKATLEWTNSGSSIGLNRIVVAKLGDAVDVTPTDSTSITANAAFGSGTDLGSGNFVVYDGSGTSVTVSGLTADTTYHFAIFEYDGSNSTQRYYSAESAVTNVSTNPAPTIWSKNDSTLVFTKADNADWTLAANQDRITDNLWLTRANSNFVFNILEEFEVDQSVSPSGTQWAVGITDTLSSLTFSTFGDIWSGEAENIPGTNMVAYIEADNLFFDINFSSWTSGGSAGGFSYTRAKGPEPSPILKTFQDSAGYALRFDDDNLYESYLEVYDSDFILGSSFTIETWVKLDSLGIVHGIMSLYNKLGFGVNADNKVYAYHKQPEASSGGGGGGECEPFCGEELNSAPNNSPKDSFSPGLEYEGPSGTINLTSTDTLAQDEWYHIALTGASGGFLKLYINGVEQDSDSVQNVGVDESNWYFGRERDQSKYLYGFMDEVRIWKTERTESQIRSYLHRPYSGDVGRLYGYWQFNEGSGTSTYDGVSNREAEFYSGNTSAWFTSDAPLGQGTAEEATDFQTGSQTVGNATLSMADGFDNPVDIQVTEVTGDPNVFPTGFTAGVGGKYFVINLFGDPGTFNASLTLNYGSGVLTSSNPAEYKLFKRGSNSTGAWTEVASAATTVNTTTGDVTWDGITAFSQFMGILDEIEFDIQLSNGSDVVAYKDSTFIFASSFFDLSGDFADSTLTISLSQNVSGNLFIDQNSNESYDSGTDLLVTASQSQTYTPSGSNKLGYEPAGYSWDTTTVKLVLGEAADSVSLDFFTVEGDPVFAGNTGENGWYLLANPFTSTIGDLLDQVWTQGAVNSSAPSSDVSIYTFVQDSAQYLSVTTDLDTTKIDAGEGLLVYLWEDDDLLDGESDVDGGWPKTLQNYGNPFGVDISVPVKNVDYDGVSGTSGSEGFVLFGNPYGWPLAADSVIATLKRADELANSYVYKWNPTAKTYEIKSTGAIDPYESVFIRVIGSGTSSSLSFDFADADASINIKKAAEEPFKMMLSQKEGDIESEMALRFDENGSTEIDPFDGYYLGSYASQFANLYTMVGDQGLSINNLPMNFAGEMEYPIYLHSTETAAFNLTWDNEALPEQMHFNLENSQTGEVIDMKKVSHVDFSNQALSKKALPFSTMLNQVKTKQSVEPVFVLRVSGTAVSNEDDMGIPREVELYQNYPNPFNPSSVIRFGVPEQARVQLEVFDVLGRKVMTLVDGDMKQPGRYNISFNARDLASGMYVYRLVIGEKVLTKKMMLIK